ncbi:MAG: AAA family ATPase [Sandaracinaceae bacterium]|nr:AAA family ATPase [Sandaracinaceae bacterium]
MEVGSVLVDRYEIVRLLGSGGMGVVFEAYDRVRGENVALKTLRRLLPSSVYSLKREFRTLADLDHPNLVRLYDLSVGDDACFFTMELVDGVDLRAYVRGGLGPDQPIHDTDRLRASFVELLRGLEALHAAGLLHRDLKPSNVKVSSSGRVVLLDFGIVFETRAARSTDRVELFGTFPYMAPEQVRGELELCDASDLYAVGVMLFEFLTGRFPFEGSGIQMLLSKQVADPPRPSLYMPGVPPDLDDLTAELLSREAGLRPTTSDAVGRLSRTSGSRRSSNPPAHTLALVGRERELEILLERFHHREPERPTLVRVRGRPGVGKSALVDEFVRRVRRDGSAIALTGRCHETESVPFKGLDAWVDALSQLLVAASKSELAALVPADAEALSTLFPVLERVAPFARSGQRDGMEDEPSTRRRGFAALREMLRRLALHHPLVLVLDDAQWADHDAALGVVDLLRGVRRPNVMVVLAERTGSGGPLSRALGDVHEMGEIAHVDLELAPLDGESIRKLIAASVADPAVVELVVAKSAGSPFAAVTLSRLFGGLDGVTSERDAHVPVEDLVRQRAASLEVGRRRALERLALAGEPSSIAQLGLERTDLDGLRSAGFVRSIRSATQDLVDTAHDLIRSSIVASVDAATRAALHRELATALLKVSPDAHDRLARHYAGAGDGARARQHALEASGQARAAYAFGRAAEMLELAASVAEASERPALMAAVAECLTLGGLYERAAARFLEASELADEDQRNEWRRRAAEALLFAGRLDQGLDLLERIADDVGAAIPRTRGAVLLQLAKHELGLSFRGIDSKIRPMVPGLERQRERVRTLGAVSVQYMPMDPFRGLVPMSRHLDAALALGDLDEVCVALGMEACARAGFGWRAGAAKTITRLERLEAEHGAPVAGVFAQLARIFDTIIDGRRDLACEHAAEAHRRLAQHRAAPPWLVSTAWFVSSFPMRFDVRPAAFDEARAYVEAREERVGRYAELRLRNLLLPLHDLLVGAPEVVIANVERAKTDSPIQRDLSNRSASENYAAWAHLYLGDAATAYRVADGVRTAFRRQGMWRSSIPRGFCAMTIAGSGLALGDAKMVSLARKDFGAPAKGVERLYDDALAAMVALSEGNTNGASAMLVSLRERAQQGAFPLFEALACWGLSSLDAGDGAARARYLAVIEGSGIVAPDRFFWSLLPVGPRPLAA